MRALLLALLTTGCLGQIGADDGSDPASTPGPNGTNKPTTAAFEPAPASLRRLTVAEYRSAIADLFGEGVTPTGLQPDRPRDGFTTVGVVAEANEDLPIAVEKLEAAGRTLASGVFASDKRAAFVACAPTASTCASEFVARFGQKVFRRPLSDEEIARYSKLVADTAATFGDPWKGFEYATVAFLTSPLFLYRVELGEADPAVATRRRYTSYEMAGRLSFFLTGSIPDAELLAAAARDELVTVEGIRAQAKRLIASPRADGAVQRFFAEHLTLDQLEGLPKNRTIFPKLTDALTRSMRKEAELLIGDTLTRDADFRELFDTRTTFVDPLLADLYGLPAPATGFAKVTIPASWDRAGLTGTAAFLAPHGKEHRGSAVLRGIFIAERFLCRSIGQPPAVVDTAALDKPVETGPITMRQRLDEHRKNPACSGCHNIIDPIGLPLEKFDGIGAHRDNDNGLAIDVSGSIDGINFQGAPGLGETLRKNPDVGPCLAKQMFRYASGHHEGVGEMPSLDQVSTAFASSGYRIRALLEEIVVSDAFRYAGDPR
jgi:hypothetical protein